MGFLWGLGVLFVGVVDVGAGVLEEVEDELEALGAFVVGVGDVVVVLAEVGAEVGGDGVDFGLCLWVGGELEEVAVVVGVHGDDDVEVGEVVDVDLAGAVGEGEVALGGVVAHSGVGELACVVVACGG